EVTPQPGTTTPSTNPQAPVSNDPDATVLGRIVVQQGDVAAARRVVLYQNGNTLRDPTLDLCNGRFPSEAHRSARLQVLDINAAGSASLSTEAGLYESPAAAQPDVP